MAAAPERPAEPAPISRRAVLRSAGMLAAGGLGVAAGFGARGLVDPTAGTPAGPAPSASLPTGLVAAETATAAPSPGQVSADDAVPRHAFRSRPDLRPPVLLVGTPGEGTAPGLLFTTPNNGDGPDGPTIYDGSGQPVWVGPSREARATDAQVATFHGRPALVWWEGDALVGVGNGHYVVADEAYTEIARIAADDTADLHEIQLTSDGTALYIAYEIIPASDAAADAGAASPAPGILYDCTIHEVEIETGQTRWSWHAADHIALAEAVVGVSDDPAVAHDPVHANSIHVDDDGSILLSARNTSAVYKIDRSTGEIVWRLGGKRSDIELLDGLSIGFQHDARRQPDGTITIFDNRQPPEVARGLVIRVDEVARTASLVRTFERPEPLHAASQGSLQVLPNGNVLVGWGSQAVMTEFGPDGSVRFDASMPAGAQSYRNRRHEWTGRPGEPPAVAVDPVRKASGGQWRVTAYASWNGATEVRAWALEAGPAEDRLERLSTMARTGFETTITGVTTTEAVTHVRVVALDADGVELGASRAVAIG